MKLTIKLKEFGYRELVMITFSHQLLVILVYNH